MGSLPPIVILTLEKLLSQVKRASSYCNDTPINGSNSGTLNVDTLMSGNFVIILVKPLYRTLHTIQPLIVNKQPEANNVGNAIYLIFFPVVLSKF